MNRRALALSLPCAAAALGAALGCETLIGADFGQKNLATCDPARPPAAASNLPNGSGASFSLAMYPLDFGDAQVDSGTPAYESIGFDLDGLCTSLLDPLPCHPPTWAGQPMTDGEHGINNGVGAMLYSEIAQFGQQPVSSAIMNARTQSGEDPPTVIFRVGDYNGFSGDAQVTVEVLLAVPLGKAPAWDGTDAFLIDPFSATSPDGTTVTGLFVDSHAYVTDFTLVAHFAPMAFKLVDVIFPLTDCILSGKLLSTQAGQWSMTGTLAGHGTTHALLSLLPQLTGSYLGLPICSNSSVYPSLKAWLCGSADSVVSGTPGPSTVCDATSFGVQFETKQVQIAGLAPSSDAGPICTAANDPSNDTCLTPK